MIRRLPPWRPCARLIAGLAVCVTVAAGAGGPVTAQVRGCAAQLALANEALGAGDRAAAEAAFLAGIDAGDDITAAVDCLIRSYGKLAGLYAVQGRLADEAAAIEARLALRERRLVENHPDLMVEAHDLAGLYMELDRPAAAARYMEQVLVFDIEKFGPDHTAVGDGHLFIAYLWDDAGEVARALPFYDRALQIYRRNMTPGHPDIDRVTRRYAAALRRHGEPQKADKLLDGLAVAPAAD